MAKILLLEDDPFLGRLLVVQLETAGYEVVWKPLISEARAALRAQSNFDLYILDLNLPDGNGLNFCMEERQQGCQLPILILTANADEDAIVKGFENGANDYVKKPFNNRELHARVRSLLREPFSRDQKIRLGPIMINLNQRRVYLQGQELTLNRREYEIFVHLTKHHGTVLSREQLLQAVQNGESISDRTIDSHFSHIRTKMKRLGVEAVMIRSVYGVGYSLEVA